MIAPSFSPGTPAAPLALREADARPGDAAYRDKLEEAAVKFEGMFVAHLLNEMRKATESMGGAGGKPDAALLDHAYRLVADDIAAQRAFGIADSIVAQMLPASSNTEPLNRNGSNP